MLGPLKPRCLILSLFCYLLAASCSQKAQCQLTLSVVPVPNSQQVTLCAQGLTDSQLAWASTAKPEQLVRRLVLSVAPEQTGSPTLPMLGRWEVVDRELHFVPSFPCSSEVEYWAVLHWDEPELIDIRIRFSIPHATRQPSTMVTSVMPTAELLPQNLLKFYVHFSAPMTRGHAYRHIELTTSDGTRVPAPFLEIAEELWDGSGKRLTLLLDPGRVKRGLVPREQDGPILSNGSEYQLRIKPDWEDANGLNLTTGFTKTFRVMREDFTQPDPANWRIVVPKARTLDPLTFEFPEPLDHALVTRGITIENAQGDIVRGEMTLSHHETQAHFRPFKEWRAGLWDIRIQSYIEDLSGNSIERPFEVERETVKSSGAKSKTITIELRP